MREEIDEIRILANWIYANRNKIEALHWTSSSDPACFADSVVSAVERVLKPTAESHPNFEPEMSYERSS